MNDSGINCSTGKEDFSKSHKSLSLWKLSNHMILQSSYWKMTVNFGHTMLEKQLRYQCRKNSKIKTINHLQKLPQIWVFEKYPKILNSVISDALGSFN